MTLPENLLTLAPEEAARRIALERLDATREAAARIEDPEDAEALHDFRVAIRRLRSTLRAWRSVLGNCIRRRHRRRLRALQGATGGGRDAEVALAWLGEQRPALRATHRRGHDWLVERLEQRLAKAMGEAREDVRSAFDRIDGDLRRRLEVMRVRIEPDETAPGTVFGEVLAAKAREEVHALAECLRQVHSSEDRSLCHASRIACKRLRYLLEPVQPHARRAARIANGCKQLQDVLGELNDAHVLREELGEALQAAAAERARRLHELARDLDDEPVRRAVRRSERPGLVELTRRVQRRIGGLFERLQKDWLVRGLDELLEEVEQLATELAQAAHPGVEIERKYLLRALPELGPDAETLEIEQGWLPGERLRERIRRTRIHGRVSYFRTVKLGRGVRRIEIEEPTTRDVFEALWPLTAGCRVHKRRHTVRDGEYLWEIDEFLDQELVLAEVELSEPDEVPALPDWLAPLAEREVTDDPAYTNLALAH